MKMEEIELYPHNQKAYDNLCAMLRDSNRACVVQPTGTGKFVIIAKMAQDNPGKNFLLLGTNDYMYIDQMANLSDIAPGFTPKNLQFMTYATAMARVTKWQFDTQGYRQRWHGRRLSLGVPRRKKEVSTDDHHQADGRAE